MLIENLESRQLLSVSTNPAGWSVITPSSGAHLIYVSSSSGKDSNSGFSSGSPVASLSKAVSLLRNNTDDEMLLKRGDTWTGGFPQWKLSGISQQQPMLIGNYGSGNRPVINTGTANGLVANTVHPVNNLFIDGVIFTAGARDPSRGTVTSSAAAATPTGLQILGPSNDITIEDSEFTFFKDNVVIEGSIAAVSNVTIRRSTIADSYCTSTRSQGLYADNMSNLTLDQDLIDHNGWNSSISGAVITVNDHDVYASASVANLVVTNSILSNAAAAGIMARSGGKIDNNLFLNNAIGISYGNANGALSTPGGVSGNINGNIFMGDHPIGSSPIGEGIELGNIKAGAGVTVSGNIFADDNELAQPAITLTDATATSNPSVCVGINDLTISNNIVYGWRSGLEIGNLVDGGKGLTGLNNLTVTGNQFQQSPAFLVNHFSTFSSSSEHWSKNTYYEANTGNWFQLHGVQMKTWNTVDSTAIYSQVKYAAPTRTVATYSSTVGTGNSQPAFLARVQSQDLSNWSSNFTTASALAYLKAGFSTSTTTPALTKLSGTTIGTSGSYKNDGNTIAKATDGNLSTFFDSATGNGNWVGLDLGSAKTIKQISFAPRSGYASRMVGGIIQVSNSANFSSGVVNVYTITAAPPQGVLTNVTLSLSTAYRYVRYLSPNGSYGNIAEFAVYG